MKTNYLFRRVMACFLAFVMVLTYAPGLNMLGLGDKAGTTASAAEAVCEIGTKTYESLQAAIDDAVDGDTITITKDIDLGNNGVTFNKAATDEITVNFGSYLVKGKTPIKITSGKITFQGTGNETSSNVQSSVDGSQYTIGVLNGASLKIESGSYATGVSSGAALRVEGNNSKATISGNTYIKGNSQYGIHVHNGGYVKVVGNKELPKISSTNGSVFAQNAGSEAVLDGGHYVGTATAHGGHILIEEGKYPRFESVVYSSSVNGSDGLVEAYGGLFDGSINKHPSTPGNIKIQGGFFKTNSIEKYLELGYAAIPTTPAEKSTYGTDYNYKVDVDTSANINYVEGIAANGIFWEGYGESKVAGYCVSQNFSEGPTYAFDIYTDESLTKLAVGSGITANIDANNKNVIVTTSNSTPKGKYYIKITGTGKEESTGETVTKTTRGKIEVVEEAYECEVGFDLGGHSYGHIVYDANGGSISNTGLEEGQISDSIPGVKVVRGETISNAKNTTAGNEIAGLVVQNPIGYIDETTGNYYAFAGWTKNNKEDNPDNYVDPNAVEIETNTIFYAHWKLADYKVIFDLNGEKIENEEDFEAIQFVKKGDTIVKPKTPKAVEEGKTFKYWSTDEDGTEHNFSYGPTRNMTLFAIWENEAETNPVVAFYGDENNMNILARVEVKKGHKIFEEVNEVSDETIHFSDLAKYAVDLPENIAKIETMKPGYKFLGFFDKKTGEEFDFNTTITEDISLVGKWEQKKVTISLSDGVTQDPAQVEVPYGSTLADVLKAAGEEVANPTKKGYALEGWFNQKTGGEEIALDGKFEDDAVIYAHFTTEYVNVYFHKEKDGDVAGNARVAEGTDIAVAEFRTFNWNLKKKDGYTFAGWYDNYGTKYEYGTPVTKDNLHVYAKWEAKNITVSFYSDTKMLDKKTLAWGSDFFDYTSQLSEKDAYPTKTGYAFAGWYDKEEGAADAALVAPSATFEEDTTVYAHFTEDNVNVLFHKMDNDDNSHAWTIGRGTQFSVAEALAANYGFESRAHKKFAGWYNSKTDEKVDFETVVNGDLEVYAKWDNEQIAVNFDFNNGVKNVITKTADYGTTYAKFFQLLTDAEAFPTKDGYTFTGWTMADDSNIDMSAAAEDNATVKATYSKNTVNVSFHYGENGEDVAQVKIGKGETLEKAEALAILYGVDITTREHYTFDKWTLKNGEEVSALTAVDSDLVVYANWTPETYDVEFTVDGKAVKSEKVAYGETLKTVLANLADPEKEGYTFLGWYAKKAKAEATTPVTANVTYAAKFEPQTFNVVVQGATNSYNEDDTAYGTTVEEVLANSPAKFRTATAKEGYDLVGWKYADGRDANLDDVLKGAATLIAQYEVQKFDVVFDANNGSMFPVDTLKDIPYGTQFSELVTMLGSDAEPTMKGYTFLGWYAGETKALPTDAITKDVTYVAKFKQNKVWINFVSPSGNARIQANEGDEFESIVTNSASKLAKLEKKAHAEFLGWFYEDGKKVGSHDEMTTNDLSVYAQFDTEQVAVTFDFNNGVNNEVVKTADYGTSYVDFFQQLSDEERFPTKADSNFDNWYASADAKTSFDMSDAVEANTTVYACYSDDMVKVRFDFGNISLAKSIPDAAATIDVVRGTTLRNAENKLIMKLADKYGAIIKNYDLAGWETIDHQAVAYDTVLTADETAVFAKWNAKQVAVNFDFNNGVNNVISKTADKGTSLAKFFEQLTDAEAFPTKEGFVFTGWDLGADKTYDTAIEEETTVTATYALDTVKVKFFYGENNTKSLEVDIAKGDTLEKAEANAVIYCDSELLKLDHNTFAGWTLKNGTAVDTLTEVNDNLVVYATWNVDTFDVVFDSETYDKPITVEDVAYGTQFADVLAQLGSKAAPAKKYENFDGWFKNAGKTKAQPTDAITGNTTYVAKFSKHQLYLRFVTDETAKEVTCNAGDEFGAVVANAKVKVSGFGKLETKNHYTFLGWYDEAGNKMEAKDVIEEDHVYHSEWKAEEVAVTFDFNNGVNNEVVKTADYGTSYVDFFQQLTDAERFPTKDGSNFAGWKLEDGSDFSMSDAVEANTTVKATYATDLVKVTFEAGYDNLRKTVEVTRGDSLQTAENKALLNTAITTRAHYTFAGWTKSDKSAIAYDAAMDENVNVVYATWTPEMIKVAFDDTMNAPKVLEAEYGSTLDVLLDKAGTPVKEHYTFKGWFNGGEKATGTEVVTEAKTYTAKYEVIKANVNFIVGADKHAIETNHGVSFAALRSANEALIKAYETKPHAEFLGWFYNDGTQVKDSDKFTDAETNVYAKFDTEQVAVNFEFNNGTQNVVTKTADWGTTYAEFFQMLTDAERFPAKADSNFDNWYASATEKTPIDMSAPVEKNATVYAQYSDDMVDVIFDLGKSEAKGIADTTVQVVRGATLRDAENKLILNKVKIAREGYDFLGWETVDHQAVAYDTALTADETAVFAVWGAKEVTVTFMNDNEDVLGHVALPYGTKFQAFLEAYGYAFPERPNSSFTGWFDASGNDANQQALAEEITEDITVYAHFTENKVNVVFHSVDKDGKEKTTEVKELGQGVSLETAEFKALVANKNLKVKTGYDFVGWTDKDGNDVAYATAMTAAETHLYAKWAVQEVKVNFYSTDKDFTQVKVNYNDDLKVALNKLGMAAYPVKPGYTFAGWFKGAEKKAEMATSNMKFTEDTTLYAHYTENKATVYFHLDQNEEASKTSELGVGADFYLFEKDAKVDTTKEGAEFLGWFTKDGKKVEYGTPIFADTHVYAKYDVEQVTVNFDDGQGHMDAVTLDYNSTLADYMAELGEKAYPTKENNSFIGWFKKAAKVEKNNPPKPDDDKPVVDEETAVALDTKFTEETTLVAHYTENTINVTFHKEHNDAGYTVEVAQGIDIYMAEYIVKKGEKLDEQSIKDLTKKDGFNFNGWTLESGEAVPYGTILTENVHVYADWGVQQVEITFANGNVVETVAMPYGTTFQKFVENYANAFPTKEGYAFKGWFTKKEDGKFNEKAKALTDEIKADETVYAQFDQNMLKVVFHSQKDDGKEYAVATDNLGEGVNLETAETAALKVKDGANLKTRKGAEFVCWTDKDGNDLNYLDEITYAKTNNDKEFHVYAKWNVEQVTVNFDDGQGHMDKATLDYNSTLADYMAALGEKAYPTKNHYTFMGWFEKAQEEDAKAPAPKAIALDKKFDKETTVYAHYSENQVKVYFHKELNENAVADATLGEGSDIYLFELAAATSMGKEEKTALTEKTGYEFDGWYTAANDEYLEKVEYGTAITENELHVYAKWVHKKVNVTFKNGTDVDTVALPYGTKFQAYLQNYDKAFPTKKGYAFVGWFDGEGKDAKAMTLTEEMKEDITVYAKFDQNMLTVVFHSKNAAGTDYTVETAALGEGVTLETAELDAIGQNSELKNREGYQFVAWVDADGNELDLKDVITFADTDINKELHVYAKWAKAEVTVTFVTSFDESGSNVKIEPVTLNYGTTFKEFLENYDGAFPTRSDCGFAGWVDKTGSFVQLDKAIEDDVTLYAKFISDFVITYDLNDPTESTLKDGDVVISNSADLELSLTKKAGQRTIYTATVKPGELATKPYSPIFAGNGTNVETDYVFEGWQEKTFFGYTDFDFTKPITRDVQLYAKWRQVEKTVYFYDPVSSTSVPVAEVKVPRGKTNFESSEIFFKGWSFTNMTSLCEQLYKAGYDSIVSQGVNGNYQFLAKTGYDFDGFYTDKACTTEWDWTDDETAITKNTKVYIKYQKQHYRVIYDKGHKDAYVDDESVLDCGAVFDKEHGRTYTQEFNYNDATDLTKNLYKRTGYTFAGWKVYAHSLTGNEYVETPIDVDFPDEAHVNALIDELQENMVETPVVKYDQTVVREYVLVAQWRTNKYNVKYDANGGQGEMKGTDSISYNDGSLTRDSHGLNITTRANEFYRIGYHFIGWNTEKDGSGMMITGNELKWNDRTHVGCYEAELASYIAANHKDCDCWACRLDAMKHMIGYKSDCTCECDVDGVCTCGAACKDHPCTTYDGKAVLGYKNVTENTNLTTVDASEDDTPIVLYAQWAPCENAHYTISVKIEDEMNPGTYLDTIVISGVGKVGDTIDVRENEDFKACVADLIAKGSYIDPELSSSFEITLTEENFEDACRYTHGCIAEENVEPAAANADVVVSLKPYTKTTYYIQNTSYTYKKSSFTTKTYGTYGTEVKANTNVAAVVKGINEADGTSYDASLYSVDTAKSKLSVVLQSKAENNETVVYLKRSPGYEVHFMVEDKYNLGTYKDVYQYTKYGKAGATVKADIYKVASSKVAGCFYDSTVKKSTSTPGSKTSGTLVKDKKIHLYVYYTRSGKSFIGKGTAYGNTGVKLSWKPVQGAAKYEILYNQCGEEKINKVLVSRTKGTVSGGLLTYTKKSGLKKYTSYKYMIYAYNKSGKLIASTANSIHTFATRCGGYKKQHANVTSYSAKLSRTTYSLKAKQTGKFTWSNIVVWGGKKMHTEKHCAKKRYCTDNKYVATVSSTGKVTPKHAGKCHVYTQTPNGLWKSFTITVK